jgi:hypothetical protein
LVSVGDVLVCPEGTDAVDEAVCPAACAVASWLPKILDIIEPKMLTRWSPSSTSTRLRAR